MVPLRPAARVPRPVEPARLDAVWSAASVRDAAQLGRYWLAHPMVQARVNVLASGRPDADAYERLGELLTQRGYHLPIREAISVGCGFGALERDLTRRGLARQILGLDLADGAIAEARRLAAVEGLVGSATACADLEGVRLPPRSVDVVFAHQSIHHVESLDALFLAIRRALRPGGVLHLHEFVGPNRFQWTDAQLELVNGFLAGCRRICAARLTAPKRCCSSGQVSPRCWLRTLQRRSDPPKFPLPCADISMS